MHHFFLLLCIIHFALCFSSCSLPSLEKPECAEARGVVKQFYSWYFGTEAHEREQHPEILKGYVSPEFPFDRGSNWESDPFVLSVNFPKTFRVGSCDLQANDKAIFKVLLLWKDDAKSEQKEVKVEVVKTGDKWLINKVFN